MARKRKNNLPNYNPDTPVASTTSTETVVQTVEVVLRLPLMLPKAGAPETAKIGKIEVQNLRQAERTALRYLYDGLVWEGATTEGTLGNQRPMRSLAADPVRYILQQISAQIPQ